MLQLLNVDLIKIDFMKNFSYGYSNLYKYSKYLSFENICKKMAGEVFFLKNGIYHSNNLDNKT